MMKYGLVILSLVSAQAFGGDVTMAEFVPASPVAAVQSGLLRSFPGGVGSSAVSDDAATVHGGAGYSVAAASSDLEEIATQYVKSVPPFIRQHIT